MAEKVCSQCGAPIEPGATCCKYCGGEYAADVVKNNTEMVYTQPQQPIYPQSTTTYSNVDPSWPVKNKLVAALLAIFLGGLGIHKFYMGKIGMGILYLVFCWTYIPVIIGLIEGIIYLTMNDDAFCNKYHVRLG